MGGPQNASINGDGFRFYRWQPLDESEPTDVLSVTSIRKLCGEQFTLVNWQLANIIDVAMSTVKRTVIGPRGGIKEVRVADEFPGEFARRLAESDGEQGKLDGLRKWLREQADHPRNVAAIRGTMVHAAIENNVQWDRIERPYVESEFAKLSERDRKRAKDGVQEEDIDFVRAAVRQYWDMRTKVPFVIIAREPQIWNLEAGYAGSADALLWVLPEGIDPKSVPKARDITWKTIQSIGGYTVLGDWKTSKGVYTDHVIQVHAYMGGEFIGSDGIVDHRLTEILTGTMKGALIHIRPDKWDVSYVDFRDDVMYAFLGSCAFARFLGRYPDPKTLFTHQVSGTAGTEEE